MSFEKAWTHRLLSNGLIKRVKKNTLPMSEVMTIFVELMPSVLIPLCSFLHTRKGKVTGISFVDSVTIAVCHNQRISSHKVFQGVAKLGKTPTG